MRLVEDYAMVGEDIPEAGQRALMGIATQLGISYGELLAYMNAARRLEVDY